MNTTQWDAVTSFAAATHTNFVFTANELDRTSQGLVVIRHVLSIADICFTGGWDNANFQELLKYTASKKISVYAWELGMHGTAATTGC